MQNKRSMQAKTARYNTCRNQTPTLRAMLSFIPIEVPPLPVGLLPLIEVPPQPAGLLEFDRNECDWWANCNRNEECNRFNKKNARNAIIQANKVIA